MKKTLNELRRDFLLIFYKKSLLKIFSAIQQESFDISCFGDGLHSWRTKISFHNDDMIKKFDKGLCGPFATQNVNSKLLLNFFKILLLCSGIKKVWYHQRIYFFIRKNFANRRKYKFQSHEAEKGKISFYSFSSFCKSLKSFF